MIFTSCGELTFIGGILEIRKKKLQYKKYLTGIVRSGKVRTIVYQITYQIDYQLKLICTCLLREGSILPALREEGQS